MPIEPDAAPDPAARAQVVPGYTLEELLGRGGSGEVWRAVPRGGGPPVAVKVLVDGDPERQAREAAALAEVDHPHLVRLHEVVHQPRRGSRARVALVLDLLEGGSLAALLARRGRLRPGEVVTTIAPVAAALAAAHDRGVVHGDLSPGNIVFTAEGRPVLTDLGMARFLGEDAAGGVTPAYVDPTVARGGAPGPASDVFGVAAAAFHALTGVPPWNAATPADRIAVAAAGQLPDLAELAPGAPPELRAVIERGLAAQPHDRGSAAAFALDLRHACRPEPVRLPAGGAGDHEPAGTARGSLTELTHVVPGRRPAAGPARPSAGRPRRGAGGAAIAAGLRRGVGRLSLVPRAGVGVALGVLATGITVWLVAARPESASPPGPPVIAAAQDGAAPSGTVPTARSASPRSTPPPAGAAAPSPPTPAVSGSGSGAPDDHAGADRQPAPDSPAGWAALVGELYRRRAAAFATGTSDLLTQVYAPGSAQLAADRNALDTLRGAGELLRGYAATGVRVTDADGLGSDGSRAQLRLVDGWSAYEVVRRDAAGASVVGAGAARAEAPVRMVLVRTAAGWRIETVERVTEDG